MPAAAVDATWIKSSRSNPNGECVEMARLPGGKVAVRNSRYPDGPALIFPRQAIAALVRGIRSGELEDLTGLYAKGVAAPGGRCWENGSVKRHALPGSLNVRQYDLKSVFLASQESRHPTRGAPVVSGEQQIEGDYPLPPGTRVPVAFSVSRTGPTVLRMVLGAALRQYREAAGISTAEAAFKIRATHSKISRMELGRVAVKQRDVDDLLISYGVTDKDERERLVELALQSAAPGWWHQYADVLPDWFERYIGLERGAAEIRGYQVQFVPGLLQTRDYARSVIRIGNRHTPEDEIDRRVKVRMERQRLLTDQQPPKVWAVLDEAALRRAPDGDAEMRAQIEHLLAVTELPHVTLQIVPFRSGAHSAAGGPFSILRFDGWDVPDVVFLEQLDSAIYLDDRQVLAYRTIWDQLAVEAAEPDESIEMLRALLRET